MKTVKEEECVQGVLTAEAADIDYHLAKTLAQHKIFTDYHASLEEEKYYVQQQGKEIVAFTTYDQALEYALAQEGLINLYYKLTFSHMHAFQNEQRVENQHSIAYT